MNIFWFLPTHGDGRYLGTAEGARAVDHHERATGRRVGDEHVREAGQDEDQPERRRPSEPEPEIGAGDAQYLPEQWWHATMPPTA